MNDCKKEYELHYLPNQRTELNWYNWCTAWNAAIRHMSNTLNGKYIQL